MYYIGKKISTGQDLGLDISTPNVQFVHVHRN